jgi:hypothetical protein
MPAATLEYQPSLTSPEDDDLFVLDDLFDDLVAQAQAQPDDEKVFEGIRGILATKQEQGDIEFVMARAMELAAMACTDPHFENIANEAGSIFSSMHGADDGHGHDGNDTRSHHEAESKSKSSKKKKAGQSLWQLIFSYGKK